jgi:hypothetical protein
VALMRAGPSAKSHAAGPERCRHERSRRASKRDASPGR